MQDDLFKDSEQPNEAGDSKHLLTKTFSDCRTFILFSFYLYLLGSGSRTFKNTHNISISILQTKKALNL